MPASSVHFTVVLLRTLRLRESSGFCRDVVYAFFVFSGLSSAVYLVNDVLDREADRHHPLKARRPIATGAIGAGAALITAAMLTGTALTAAFLMAPAFGLVAATYCAASRTWGAAPPCVRQTLMPVIAAFLHGWPVRDECAEQRGDLFAASSPAFRGAAHPGVAVALGGGLRATRVDG
jgi:4-hydroxybenzoate polyprenyltransferase